MLEVLVRGAAAGIFLGLAIVIGRGGFAPARITGVLFSLAAAAHTLTQFPAMELALGWIWAPIWALSAMGAGLFWAFATELFEDRQSLDPYRFAPAAVLLAVGLASLAAPPPAAQLLLLAHNLFSAALMVNVFFVIATGWRGDLVETRRNLRGPVLAAAALYAVAVIVVQISEILWRPAAALSPFAAAALLLLGLASSWALLQANPDLFGRTAAPMTAPAVKLTAASDKDAKTLERLDRLMREERVYRADNLAIAALARRLDVPEYKLRRLINQHLGHRNFNAFLNAWRLSEARQALADPGQRDVPISTIALDAGFQSLGPFNRTFRDDTGVTPTEFRAQALAGDRSGAATSA